MKVAKGITTKSTRRVLYIAIAIFACLVTAITSAAVYFTLNGKKSTPNRDPLSWSVDVWQGESMNGSGFISDFAERGSDTITIDSAESFIWFVNMVNNGITYRGRTIYLNKSIDFGGREIESIGNGNKKFEGTFDGSYYTLMNLKVKGDGLFGVTNDATIRNLGLYNVQIDSSADYVGGLIGRAYNTNIEDSFVRLGKVKGVNNVGGLVGLYVADDGGHIISRSFADIDLEGRNVGGLIGRADINNINNKLYIEYSYYINANRVVGNDVEEGLIDSASAIKPNGVGNFAGASWGYSSNYDIDKVWCDYVHAADSRELSFDYPILTRFAKTYLVGAYYENTLKIGEESKPMVSFSQAVSEIPNGEEATITFLAEQLVSEDSAVVISGNKKVTLKAAKNTTITRSQVNDNAIIYVAEGSELTLGIENGGESTPTLILDGNRDWVEANGKTSGSLVVAKGKVYIHDGLVARNNIANKPAEESDQIAPASIVPVDDYDAAWQTGNYDGGGFYLSSAEMTGGTITNCQATGSGGGIYGYDFKMSGGFIEECSADWGGGVLTMFSTEMSGGTIRNCSATTNGGGWFAMVAWNFAFRGGSIENCYAGRYGGGIYCSGNIDIGNDVYSYPSITSCRAQKGAAIYMGDVSEDVSYSASMTIVGYAQIYNCSSSQHGDAIYIEQSYDYSYDDPCQDLSFRPCEDYPWIDGSIYLEDYVYIYAIDNMCSELDFIVKSDAVIAEYLDNKPFINVRAEAFDEFNTTGKKISITSEESGKTYTTKYSTSTNSYYPNAYYLVEGGSVEDQDGNLYSSLQAAFDAYQFDSDSMNKDITFYILEDIELSETVMAGQNYEASGGVGFGHYILAAKDKNVTISPSDSYSSWFSFFDISFMVSLTIGESVDDPYQITFNNTMFGTSAPAVIDFNGTTYAGDPATALTFNCGVIDTYSTAIAISGYSNVVINGGYFGGESYPSIDIIGYKDDNYGYYSTFTMNGGTISAAGEGEYYTPYGIKATGYVDITLNGGSIAGQFYGTDNEYRDIYLPSTFTGTLTAGNSITDTYNMEIATQTLDNKKDTQLIQTSKGGNFVITNSSTYYIDANGYVRDVADKYVASVGDPNNGGTKYETLQAALDAATNGSTVYVLKDVTLSEAIAIQNDITLRAYNKDVTIAPANNINCSKIDTSSHYGYTDSFMIYTNWHTLTIGTDTTTGYDLILDGANIIKSVILADCLNVKNDVVIKNALRGIDGYCLGGDIKISGGLITECDETGVFNYNYQNFTLSGGTISHCGVGVLLDETYAQSLSGARIEYCDYGIKINYADIYTISNIVIDNSSTADIFFDSRNTFDYYYGTYVLGVTATTEDAFTIKANANVLNGVLNKDLKLINTTDKGTLFTYFDSTYEITADGYLITKPTEIKTVSEFKNIKSGTNYRLANDIDLRSESFGLLSYSLISSYSGDIDGNGKTIYMPTKGNTLQKRGVLINEFTGTLRNVTLHFDNINNADISFCAATKGVSTFSNVTTTGNINNTNSRNYSPLVSLVYADITFVDCTNNLNMYGAKYGSAFIGGYIDTTPCYDYDETTQIGNSGIVKGVKETFIRCVNNGTIDMDTASMFHGNTNRIPTVANLYVEDCVNNGLITGSVDAAIWCAHNANGVASAGTGWLRKVDDHNAYTAENVTGTGSIVIKTREGFTADYDIVTRKITTANPNAIGGDKIVLTVNGQLRSSTTYNGVTETITYYAYADIVLTTDSNNIANYGNYEVIEKKYIDQLKNEGAFVSQTQISCTTRMEPAVASGDSIKLYLITANKYGTTRYYYYFEVNNGNFEYSLVSFREGTVVNFPNSVRVVDNQGKQAGSIVLKYRAARIGEQYYTSISEAVENAVSGDTIYLLDHWYMGGTLVISKSLTFVAEGQDVYIERSFSTGNMFTINNGSTVTFGSSVNDTYKVDINNKNVAYNTINVGGASTLKLYAGHIHESTATDAVYINKSCKFYMYGGEIIRGKSNVRLEHTGVNAYDQSYFEMNGGLISNEGLSGANSVYLGQGSTMKFTGGTICNTISGMYINAGFVKLDMTGGTIKDTTWNGITITASNNIINILGGTINTSSPSIYYTNTTNADLTIGNPELISSSANIYLNNVYNPTGKYAFKTTGTITQNYTVYMTSSDLSRYLDSTTNKLVSTTNMGGKFIPISYSGSASHYVTADGYLKTKPAVARIGSTTYASLEEAISAASAGATIEILQDITLDRDLIVNKTVYFVAGEKDITINGNYQIKVTNGASLSHAIGAYNLKYENSKVYVDSNSAFTVTYSIYVDKIELYIYSALILDEGDIDVVYSSCGGDISMQGSRVGEMTIWKGPSVSLNTYAGTINNLYLDGYDGNINAMLCGYTVVGDILSSSTFTIAENVIIDSIVLDDLGYSSTVGLTIAGGSVRESITIKDTSNIYINVSQELTNTYSIDFESDSILESYYNTDKPLVEYSAGSTPKAKNFSVEGYDLKPGAWKNFKKDASDTTVYDENALYVVDVIYVAELNGVQYTDLQDAFDNTTGWDNIIYILDDIVLVDTVYDTNYTASTLVAKNGDHTILGTMSGDMIAQFNTLKIGQSVNDQYKLTLDGNSSVDTIAYGIYIYNYSGTLRNAQTAIDSGYGPMGAAYIYGGLIEGFSSYAIRSENFYMTGGVIRNAASGIHSEYGDVSITGGTIDCDVAIEVSNPYSLTIRNCNISSMFNDITLSGDVYSIWTDSIINIDDNETETYTIYMDTSFASSLYPNGKKLINTTTSGRRFIYSGYDNFVITEDGYIINADTYKVRNGDTFYTSLDSAVADAERNDTLYVIGDIELYESVNIDKVLTITAKYQDVSISISDDIYEAFWITSSMTLGGGEDVLTINTNISSGYYYTLTINNCIINGDMYTDAVVVNDGIINGDIIAGDGGSVIITGGTINGCVQVGRNGPATLVITGGEINSTGEYDIYMGNGSYGDYWATIQVGNNLTDTYRVYIPSSDINVYLNTSIKLINTETMGTKFIYAGDENYNISADGYLASEVEWTFVVNDNSLGSVDKTSVVKMGNIPYTIDGNQFKFADDTTVTATPIEGYSVSWEVSSNTVYVNFYVPSLQNARTNKLYRTLQEAVNDANNGDTIFILNNINAHEGCDEWEGLSINKDLTFRALNKNIVVDVPNTSIKIYANVTLGIDTDEFTVKYLNENGYNSLFDISSGTLTVNNAELYSSETGVYVSGGNLTVNGGTIYGWYKSINGYGPSTINGGTITGDIYYGYYGIINGGTINGNILVDGGYDITMTGGTINGYITLGQSGPGKLAISGGEINSTGDFDIYMNSAMYGSDWATIQASGTLTDTYRVKFNSSDISSYLGTELKVVNTETLGLHFIYTGEGNYTITADGYLRINYAARIGTTYYESLSEAFSAARSNDVIYVLSNATLTAGITVQNKNITLVAEKDVTITRNGSFEIISLYGGCLTIGNSTSNSHTITFDGAGFNRNIISANNVGNLESLVLNSGIFQNTTASAISSRGFAVINGGVITNCNIGLNLSDNGSTSAPGGYAEYPYEVAVINNITITECEIGIRISPDYNTTINDTTIYPYISMYDCNISDCTYAIKNILATLSEGTPFTSWTNSTHLYYYGGTIDGDIYLVGGEVLFEDYDTEDFTAVRNFTGDILLEIYHEEWEPYPEYDWDIGYINDYPHVVVNGTIGNSINVKCMNEFTLNYYANTNEKLITTADQGDKFISLNEGYIITKDGYLRSPYTVTISVNNADYGYVDMASVDVYYGVTYTTSGDTITFSNGVTVTAIPNPETEEISYEFDSWSSESGTITGDDTIIANFKMSYKNTTITTPSDISATYGYADALTVTVTAGGGNGTYTYSIVDASNNTDGLLGIVPTVATQGGATITFATGANAGTYTFKVKAISGNGTMATTDLITITINPYAIADTTITLEYNEVVYDGNAKTPSVTVKMGDNTMDSSNYDVAYADNTNVGTATVTITGKANLSGIATKEFVITPAKVSIPTENTTVYTYNGSEQEYLPTNWEDIKDLADISGNTRTEAGSQTVTVSLKDKDNYLWTDDSSTDKTFTFVINRQSVEIPTSPVATHTYTGASIAHGYTAPSGTSIQEEGTTANAVNVGTYDIVLVVDANHKWSDDTTGTKTVNWIIEAKDIADTTITLEYNEVVYDGNAKTPTVTVKIDDVTIDSSNYDVDYTDNTNAGKATVTISGKANLTGTASVQFDIIQKSVNIPSQNGTLTYNGDTQSPVWDNYNDEIMTIGGTTSATNAGTYEATFTLDANHKWSDESIEVKSITWIIGKADGYITVQSSSQEPEYPNVAENTITSNHGGDITVVSSDETIATVSRDGDNITVTPKKTGTITITVTCAENTNYFSATTTYSVTFVSGVIGFNVEAYNGVYDKTAHAVIVTPTIAGEVTITYGTSEDDIILTSSPEFTNVGTYTVYFKLVAEGYNDRTGSAEIIITPAKVSIPTENTTVYTYNGSEQEYLPTNWEDIKDLADISGNTRTEAGSQTVTVSLKDKDNYLWTDDSSTDKTFTFVINRQSVEIPTSPVATHTYTGASIAHGYTAPSGTSIQEEGTIVNAVNVGTYDIVLVVDANHKWSDDTTGTKTVNWIIEGIKLTNPTNPTWTDVTVASWTASTAVAGITTTYQVELKDGDTVIATKEVSTTTVDFASEIYTNGTASYTFEVIAQSSNTTNCANSDRVISASANLSPITITMSGTNVGTATVGTSNVKLVETNKYVVVTSNTYKLNATVTDALLDMTVVVGSNTTITKTALRILENENITVSDDTIITLEYHKATSIVVNKPTDSNATVTIKPVIDTTTDKTVIKVPNAEVEEETEYIIGSNAEVEIEIQDKEGDEIVFGFIYTVEGEEGKNTQLAGDNIEFSWQEETDTYIVNNPEKITSVEVKVCKVAYIEFDNSMFYEKDITLYLTSGEGFTNIVDAESDNPLSLYAGTWYITWEGDDLSEGEIETIFGGLDIEEDLSGEYENRYILEVVV